MISLMSFLDNTEYADNTAYSPKRLAQVTTADNNATTNQRTAGRWRQRGSETAQRSLAAVRRRQQRQWRWGQRDCATSVAAWQRHERW